MSLSSSLNGFSHRLFATIGSEIDENFFISPFSISTALSMCLIGARDETVNQLKDLLGLSTLNDQQILDLNHQLMTSINSFGESINLKTANKLYLNQNFEILDEFLNSVQKNFHAGVEGLNFGNPAQSAQVINTWVSEQTNDKIKNLVEPSLINDLTKLILINAIYFKGDWSTKFDPKLTSPEDFHLKDGSVKKVDMMKNKKKFRYLHSPSNLKADVCELFYNGEETSMSIILPHEGHSIDSIEKDLNESVLNGILTSPKSTKIVNLHVPKFKLKYNVELVPSLKKLGAHLPFDQEKADFSGISSRSKGLAITNVIHQAFVEVNEQGTEAAAATAVVMRLKCAAPRLEDNVDFICNRPFLFLIHEKKHNGILFFGKYCKPE